jgi:hypothetical protein
MCGIFPRMAVHMTVLPPVSLSIILQLPLSRCTSSSARKNLVHVSFSFYIEDCVSRKLHNLNLCKSGTFCTALMNVHNKLNECDTDLHSTHITKNLNFYNFIQLHMWLESLLSSVLLCKWLLNHAIYSCES